MPPLTREAAGASVQALLARRSRSLSPTYGHFYADPINFVRAEGVWMYDDTGERYLDVYNNVPVAGHCHPHVVEALARQASLLNTHTRYLHAGIVDLADRLLATFPSDIEQLIFTCTGSEANDLAYRIAKVVTGGTGFIVTEHAYHGATAATAGLSPSLGSGEGLGSNVYLVPVPVTAPADNVADAFVAGVSDALARMRADGVRPAALLVDTIFASDGVLADPPGLLQAAVEQVRAEGGLFIADEVQPGFGRTGDALWGFQRHGVTPDIVTMGKPMGNGHPIAALAARGKLLGRFREASRYFNTFAGNPVSAAVASAVLDVIERERLVENARMVGLRMRDGLLTLAAKYRCVGAVRGVGLYFGVDVEPLPGSGGSGRDLASVIVNDLRKRRILIGTAGRNGNSLKLRPPLPFGEEHLGLFLSEFERTLQACAAQ